MVVLFLLFQDRYCNNIQRTAEAFERHHDGIFPIMGDVSFGRKILTPCQNISTGSTGPHNISFEGGYHPRVLVKFSEFQNTETESIPCKIKNVSLLLLAFRTHRLTIIMLL